MGSSLAFPVEHTHVSSLGELARQIDCDRLGSFSVLDFTGFSLPKVSCSEDIESLSSDDIACFSRRAYDDISALVSLSSCKNFHSYLRCFPSANLSSDGLQILNSIYTGSLRSLQSEYLHLRICSLSLPEIHPSERIASHILSLLTSQFLPSDCSLSRDYSLYCRVTRSEKLSLDEVGLSMHPNEWNCVFVFGGASAITYECLKTVVHSRTRIFLFGRRSNDDIGPVIKVLAQYPNIRSYVLACEPQHCKNISQLRARITYLESQKELSSILSRLENRCESVTYISVDLTSSEVLAKALQDYELDDVRPTAVVYSAGLLRDSLFRDKSFETFFSVISVKAAGILNVFRHVDFSCCHSIYLFGSVSGTYGNKGQTDYSAANESLFRIAKIFSGMLPNQKTVVLNWGPWADVGMATPEVISQFESRGIYPLLSRQAVRCFLRSVNTKACGFHSPIYGYADWNDLELTFNTGLPPNMSSVQKLRSQYVYSGSALRHFIEISESTTDSYLLNVPLLKTPLLRHHVLGDNYVIPLAFFVELFLHSLLENRQSEGPLVVENLRCLRGVQSALDREYISILLTWKSPSGAAGLSADVRTTDSAYANYSAWLRTDLEFVEEPELPTLDLGESTKILPSPEHCYINYLFHGPSYQIICEIVSITDSSITATVVLAGASSDLSVFRFPFWICPPPLFDSFAQLALIWRRIHDGSTALPSSFSCLTIFRPELLTGSLTVQLANVAPDGDILTFDVYVFTHDGVLCLVVRSMQCTCSPALSRLNLEWHKHQSQSLGL